MYLAGLAIVLAASCTAQDAADDAPADLAVDWSGKNCLVIVLDALTVNHLAMWGYDRETTPNIDRLAARGVVFKYARSQASSTPPSVYSYFTGRYPPFLLRDDSMRMVYMPDDQTTFAEAFKERNYETAAFSGNLFCSAKAGFDQGFDTFELILRHLPVNEGELELDDDSTSKLLDSAQAWIQSRAENPWLCYVHILRPHNPYRAPEPQGSAFAGDYVGPADGNDAYWKSVGWSAPPEDIPHLKDYYDGNLLYADALVGQFLDDLDATGDLENTAIVVTSDHGEAFMEHGYTLHNVAVHEELIRVPLIVVPPKNAPIPPRVVREPVQLIDLFPTMTAVFQLPSASNVDGVSLMPALGGFATKKRPMFAQDGDGDMMCIINDNRKLLVMYDRTTQSFRPIEYYHLRRDPHETRNLWRDVPPPIALEMFERAQPYIESHIQTEKGQGENLIDFEKEVLETLGYL